MYPFQTGTRRAGGEPSCRDRIEVEVLEHLCELSPHTRWWRIAVALALLLLATGPAAAADEKPAVGRWHHSFEEAAAEAKRLDLPLLVHFYADWCIPCKRMEQESLDTPAVLKQLGRQFVGVKVDIELDEETAGRFKIESLPGDLVLAPDGEVLARSSGYQAQQIYLRQMFLAHAQFQRNSDDGTSLATNVRPGTNGGEQPAPRPVISARPASRSKTDSPAPFTPRPVRVARPPIGMDGYNPVALFQHRRWQRGDARFAALYKGIEYRFNSAQDQQSFLTSPAQYAPQLLGCDPVILQETDRARHGDTKHAAYFEGRLYLFVNEETRLKFKRQPLQYVRTRHVLMLEEDPAEQPTQRR